MISRLGILLLLAAIVEESAIRIEGDAAISIGDLSFDDARLRAKPCKGRSLVASCVASSELAGNPCRYAYDGRLSTAWATNGEGVGAWILLNFNQEYYVSRMTFTNRESQWEANRRVKLTFSDGSTQELSIDLAKGLVPTTIQFEPRATTSIRVEITAVWFHFNNGAKEIGFNCIDPPTTTTPEPTTTSTVRVTVAPRPLPTTVPTTTTPRVTTSGQADSRCWTQADSLSDFSSQAKMEAGGWVLDSFSKGTWKFGDEFEGSCSGNCSAVLRTTMQGHGLLALVVQNAQDDPADENNTDNIVRVFHNQEEVENITGGEEKVVGVTYWDGDEIRITEVTGTMRLKYVSCGHAIPGNNDIHIMGSPRMLNVFEIGQSGTVDGVYAHAAPPAALPPFRNPLTPDGCFPGLRTWTARRTLGIKFVDSTPQISGWLGWRHPYMEAAELNVKTHRTTPYMCSERVTTLPRAMPAVMNDPPLYIEEASHISPLHFNLTTIGVAVDGHRDRFFATGRRIAREHGWRLVGAAYQKGGWFYVGWSASYLFQQPDTKVCQLTFQGSKSLGDWVANLHFGKATFCGLTDEDEKCCSSRRPSGSWVHRGLRNKFRAVTQNRDWQQVIRPKLSKCSQVLVVGHSMGGAVAEMFAACQARAPHPGEFGYEEDYKYISWTREVPTLLPEY